MKKNRRDCFRVLYIGLRMQNRSPFRTFMQRFNTGFGPT